ncbi:hypothetical protein NC652_009858 [Populus alba x Populus x berolinensis]|nr:hypothetical protein NC652_009858 [Populus alba x Populus x berolinensis]
MFLDLGIKFKVMGFLLKLQIRFAQYQVIKGKGAIALRYEYKINARFYVNVSSGVGLKYSSSA